MIVGIGHWDRTNRTVHSGQVGLTGQPRQVSLEGQRVHDNNDRTAASGELWTRLLDRAAGTGQMGLDSRDKTDGAGKPGQDMLEQGNLGRSALIGQTGQERRDRSLFWDMTTRTGQPKQVRLDKAT
jgi:hypothetical protein